MSTIAATGTVAPERARSDILMADPVLVVLTTIPFATVTLLNLVQAADRTSMAVLAVVCGVSCVAATFRVRVGFGRTADVGLFVLHLGMIFWFYWPAVATALSSAQWAKKAARIRIDNTDALFAFLLVTLFHYVIVMAYMVAPRLRSVGTARKLFGEGVKFTSGRFVLRLMAVWFTLAMGFYVVVSGSPVAALHYAQAGRSSIKPWSAVGNYGTSLTPIHIIAQASLVVIAVLGFTLLLTRNRDAGIRLTVTQRVIMFAIAGFALYFVSVDSGTRATMLECILPAVVLFYRRLHDRASPRKNRTAAYILIALIAVGSILGASYQRKYRYTKVGSDYYETMEVELKVKDNDFFTYAAYAVAIQREENTFNREIPLVQIITGPIPRVWWPSKPASQTVIVFSRYVWGVEIEETGGNTLPSVVGQWWMSWGWGGVIFVALLLGRLTRIGDAAFATSPSTLTRTVYAVILSYIFVGFRLLAFNFFAPVIMALVLVRYLRHRDVLWRRDASEHTA